MLEFRLQITIVLNLQHNPDYNDPIIRTSFSANSVDADQTAQDLSWNSASTYITICWMVSYIDTFTGDRNLANKNLSHISFWVLL